MHLVNFLVDSQNFLEGIRAKALSLHHMFIRGISKVKRHAIFPSREDLRAFFFLPDQFIYIAYIFLYSLVRISESDIAETDQDLDLLPKEDLLMFLMLEASIRCIMTQ